MISTNLDREWECETWKFTRHNYYISHILLMTYSDIIYRTMTYLDVNEYYPNFAMNIYN